MNKLAALLLLLMVATTAFGQYAAHYEKKALASFYSKDYRTALLYSEKVLEIDERNVASLFVAGESARFLDDLPKAESYLELIPDHAKAGYYAVTDYRLGSLKHDMAKLEDAKFYYEKFLTYNNQDNDLLAYLANQALLGIDAGEKNRRSDLVQLERLGDNINSDRAELSPLRYADKLYFASVVEENYIRVGKRGQEKQHPVTRIFEAQFTREAHLLDENPGKATKNASNIALMPDASRMYYTLCSDDDYLRQQSCEIWYRDRQYEGDWGAAVRLPQNINIRGYTATQPSIGYDRQLRRFMLYFSSDRPGGMGGMDIWCSELNWEGTEFGEPQPLPINTAQNEVTPFFHQVSQTLFFSSNGWPNAGGLDVFQAKKATNGDWEEPQNLGEYVNSEYDDLYYTYHTNTRNAYFVSDRPGSNCANPTARGMDCADIYQARIFVDLELEFFNASDNSVVYGAQVDLMEVKNGSKASIATADGDNQMRLRLEPGKQYQLRVSAQGHPPKVIDLNTESYGAFATLEQEVYLDGFARPLIDAIEQKK